MPRTVSLLLLGCLCAFAPPAWSQVQADRVATKNNPSREAASERGNQPDLILYGGKVFTADPAHPWAEALSIRGERILAVGSDAAVRSSADPSTRAIDLGGRVVIPGINDAHDHIGHVAPLGRFFRTDEPMLPGPSLAQVLDSLSAIVKGLPPGTWIKGEIGLRMIEDPKARREALDQVAPNHPVLLYLPWGHGTILNSAALRELGISDTEADPVAGSYERDPRTQRITGLLRGMAELLAQRRAYSRLPDSVLARVYSDYATAALRWGITSVQNMTTFLEPERTVQVLQQVHLPFRLRMIPLPATSARGRLVEEWSHVDRHPSPRVRFSGMKSGYDETPLERGALMRRPYADRPGWYGQLSFPLDTLRQILREGLAGSEQLMFHVVGDSSSRILLSQMSALADEASWRPRRVRMEHADGLIGQDVWERARGLGIVVVVNPVHFAFAEAFAARFGQEFLATFQPLRSLIEAGIPVAIGSDGPNNPYLNVMMATLHPTNPREAITREQAINAYTWASAYAEFAEHEKGRLAPGMLADLAVLSQDIFTVPTEALPGTVSILTLVGGNVAYDAGVLHTQARQ